MALAQQINDDGDGLLLLLDESYCTVVAYGKVQQNTISTSVKNVPPPPPLSPPTPRLDPPLQCSSSNVVLFSLVLLYSDSELGCFPTVQQQQQQRLKLERG